MKITPNERRLLIAALRCYASSRDSKEIPPDELQALIAKLRSIHRPKLNTGGQLE